MRALLQEIGDPSAFDKIFKVVAEQTAVNGEMVIAAAVVVLSHSTADDVFTGACDLAVELDPAGWISELNMDREVTLGMLREKGAEGIFALELERLRKQLPAKSLPRRAELLFRHVKIRHNSMHTSTDPEHFSQSALKEADELRHSIVHGTGLPRIDLPRTRNTFLLLHEAATTALRSLGAQYALPIDQEILLGSKRQV